MDQSANNALATIAALTEAAGLAAARGEWNQVDHYLQLRETRLPQETLSPEAHTSVLAVDRVISEHIRVAQAGLASLLEESAKTRRRLQELRQWNGVMSSDSGTIERTI